MEHSVHNVDISKTLAHTTQYKLSAICPVQLKPGFINEEHFSSVPVAIEGERLHTEVGYDAELQSCEDPGEDDEDTDELP